jgi:hypothetical protein
MRRLIESLERAGFAWYLTGSEALAIYASPRQTMDVDLVVDATREALDELADGLEDAYYYAEPIRIGNRLLAALVDREGSGKVDLIVRDADPWGRVAMSRRRRWSHPDWGPIWVSSLEDLILAKLEWSEGTSELQLRDCHILLRMNRERIDGAYLATWARALDVTKELHQVEEGSTGAS